MSAPERDRPAPQYPEQGTYRAPDAVDSLLPPGLAPERATVLFVHAHPDDESTATGAAMGALAQAGARVELLTMTRGEMGEVIGPEHAELDVRTRPDGDGGDALGALRRTELDDACDALGVHGHRFARRPGRPGFFRDSGMSWAQDGTAAPDPRAAEDSLARAPLYQAATAVADVIRGVRPDVVVTYDVDGGYGHPDHRRTHEAVLAALPSLPRGSVPLLVWGEEGEADPSDARRQAVVHGSLEAKQAAMAAHRTQVRLGEGQTFQYSNEVVQPISPVETYRLLAVREGQEELAGPGGVHTPAESEQAGGPETAETATSETGNPTDRLPAGRVVSGLTSVCLGLLLGFLGTMLHASIAYLDSGWWIPWGAILAVAAVFCCTVWTAHTSLRRGIVLVPGLVCFLVIGVFMFARPDARLVVASAEAPIGIAGFIWSLGTMAATCLGMVVADRRILRPRGR